MLIAERYSIIIKQISGNTLTMTVIIIIFDQMRGFNRGSTPPLDESYND